MVNKAKCSGINLGRKLAKSRIRSPKYDKIMKISKKNSESLKEKITGPYRFGCI